MSGRRFRRRCRGRRCCRLPCSSVARAPDQEVAPSPAGKPVRTRAAGRRIRALKAGEAIGTSAAAEEIVQRVARQPVGEAATFEILDARERVRAEGAGTRLLGNARVMAPAEWRNGAVSWPVRRAAATPSRSPAMLPVTVLPKMLWPLLSAMEPARSLCRTSPSPVSPKLPARMLLAMRSAASPPRYMPRVQKIEAA